MVCIPSSLSQNGPALGALAGESGISKVVKSGESGISKVVKSGESGISKVVKSGGFKHIRRVAQTWFNIVYDAKP